MFTSKNETLKKHQYLVRKVECITLTQYFFKNRKHSSRGIKLHDYNKIISQ